MSDALYTPAWLSACSPSACTQQAGTTSAAAAAAVASTNRPRLPHAGDDGDIPEALKKYVDGSAQLPVKTYFIGGYGEQPRDRPAQQQ